MNLSSRYHFQRCVQRLRTAGIPDAYNNCLQLLERSIRPVTASSSSTTTILTPSNVDIPPVTANDNNYHFHTYSRAATEGLLRRNINLHDHQLQIFNSFIQRRCTREPLQHILEEWDFAGLTNLIVRKPLLCPRTETEQMVTLIERIVRSDSVSSAGYPRASTTNYEMLQPLPSSSLSSVRCSSTQPYRMIEVGIGTGALSCALLSRIPSPKIISSITGLDIQPVAVQVSQENAEKFHVLDRFRPILTDALHWRPSEEDRYDYVIANPPYIPTEYMDTLDPEVRLYEDKQALDGKAPYGLGFILQLLSTVIKNEWLNTPNSKIILETDILHPFVLASICPSSQSLYPTESDLYDNVNLSTIHYTIGNEPSKIYDADEGIPDVINTGPGKKTYRTWTDILQQLPSDVCSNKLNFLLLEKVIQSIPLETKQWLRMHYQYDAIYYDYQRLPRFIVLSPRRTDRTV